MCRCTFFGSSLLPIFAFTDELRPFCSVGNVCKYDNRIFCSSFVHADDFFLPFLQRIFFFRFGTFSSFSSIASYWYSFLSAQLPNFASAKHEKKNENVYRGNFAHQTEHNFENIRLCHPLNDFQEFESSVLHSIAFNLVKLVKNDGEFAFFTRIGNIFVIRTFYFWRIFIFFLEVYNRYNILFSNNNCLC